VGENLCEIRTIRFGFLRFCVGAESAEAPERLFVLL
jgi:hypothetical protein